MNSRVQLEVDLDGLAYNLRTIREHVAPCRIMAVLKANAYGLDTARIAPVVREQGAELFAAATVGEALELSRYGLPVQILGNLLPDEVAPAVEHGIICPLNGLESARSISAEAVRQKKQVSCALTIDSGMGRLGMIAGKALDEIRAIRQLPNLNIRGIYSHFSSASDPEDDYSELQISRFRELLDTLQCDGMSFDKIHMAASDGLNNFSGSVNAPFTHVRCGINMYGYYAPKLALKEIVMLKTRIAAVRRMSAGSPVGYNRTHYLKKDTLVAVAAIGYADGVPLALSNRGHFLIHGIPCPILGRISMDYTVVSLENVSDAVPGDEVVCFGRQGNGFISAKEWADLAGTHIYDILCAVTPRR